MEGGEREERGERREERGEERERIEGSEAHQLRVRFVYRV